MLNQSELRQVIASRGLTITQVAAAAGVTEARIRVIVACRDRAKPETIERIERAIVAASRGQRQECETAA